jgi:hypothetical protein
MKILLTTLFTLLTLSTHAHDEGHGPAIKDESIHGGKVTAIILKEDVDKGRGAKMLYKGELVFDSRKTAVKLYLYNEKMKPLDLTQFEKETKAVLIERGKEKEFSLMLDKSGKYFSGNRPKNKRVPFNIDVFPKTEKQNLFGAFDGLD